MAADKSNVSIHAPTWGATRPLVRHLRFRFQFQSTHPRGVRHSFQAFMIIKKMFQSTHPRGVRLLTSSATEGISLFQSTHPRGVRQDQYDKRVKRRQFQSTHPRGVRLPLGCNTTLPCLCFNPRTHVGCDPRPETIQQNPICFNPRTHVGCDFHRHRRPRHPAVSIHAPTWGATWICFQPGLPISFQSTHPRGVRRSTSS